MGTCQCAYLEVDVFQSPHDDAVQWLLRQLQAGVLLQALDVHEGAHQLGIQQRLVGQPLNVLGRVRVNVLERASELVIEPLDKGNNASWDAEDLARCDGRQLLVVLPLLGVFNDNNLVAVLEDLEQLAKLLVGPGTVSRQLVAVRATLTASIGPGACGSQCRLSGQSAWK